MFANFETTTPPLAGSPYLGGQSLTRASGNINHSEKEIVCGTFVAIKDNGIDKISKADDVLAGVAMHAGHNKQYEPKEIVTVGNIGFGDAIWCLGDGDIAFGDRLDINLDGKVVKAVAEVEVPTKKTKAAAVIKGNGLVALKVSGDLIAVGRK